MGSEVQSLLRGLALLEVLAGLGGRAGFAKICSRAQLAPATAHRLLATLVEAGYILRDEDNAYILAYRILNIAGSIHRRTAYLRTIARPHLEALATETQELANLVTLDGRCAIYIDQAEGARVLRMSIQLGSAFPVNTSASAKAILAFRPDYDLGAAFAEGHVRRHTRRTIVDLKSFRIELRRTRERGYAIEHEELEEGISCIAAPILDSQNIAVAALSVPGPTSRIIGSSPDRLGKVVKRYADAVAALLPKGPSSSPNDKRRKPEKSLSADPVP